MKKVFLSLAALAMVAVGTVSCGSDDSSTPTPTPVDDTPGTGLTENFIQVNDDQAEISQSIYAVLTDGAGNDAPVKVYTDDDGNTFAGFYFISHDGSSPTQFGDNRNYLILYTPFDTSLPENEALKLPFTVEGTQMGGIITLMNDTEYSYADGFTFNFDAENTSYATQDAEGTLAYTIEGTDETDTSISLKANVNTPFDGLYGMNGNASGKSSNSIHSAMNMNLGKVELHKRK